MTLNRGLTRIAVYVIPIRGDEILCLRRFNTGYEDGNYGLISGHVELHETVLEAAIREASEETGLKIELESLEFLHVMQRLYADGLAYYDFYFLTRKWEGIPSVREPSKCDAVGWFSLENLPSNTVGYIREMLDSFRKQGRFFSERLHKDNKAMFRTAKAAANF